MAVRDNVGKKGYISGAEPKILDKLGINAEIWLDTVDEYNKGYNVFSLVNDASRGLLNQILSHELNNI